MALDARQNFVSAQYLQNELTEFNQIVVHVWTLTLTRSSLGLLDVFFREIVTKLWPLMRIRISFPLSMLTMS